MTATNRDDFRFAANTASKAIIQANKLSCPLNSESSLCLANERDETACLYRIALLPWIPMSFSLLLFGTGIVYAILAFTPWVDWNLKTTGIILGSFAAGIFMWIIDTKVDSSLFEGSIRNANGEAFIARMKNRITTCWKFAIEDPATYKKQKLISEDYAIGGLDPTGQALLLAGCQCKYVLRTADVIEFREDQSTLLVSVQIASETLTLALTPLIADTQEDAQFRDSLRNVFGSIQATHQNA